MKHKLEWSLFIICAAVVVFNCSQPMSGGGGSDIPNGSIVVSVANTTMDVSVPVNAKVYVLSADYNASFRKGYVDSLLVTTNSKGEFLLPQEGLYNVIAFTVDNENGAYIRHIPLQTGGSVLQRSASFEGLSSLSGNTSYSADSTTVGSVTVFMVGTLFKVVSDLQGVFTFNALPHGTYTVKAFIYLPCSNSDAPCQAVPFLDTLEATIDTTTNPPLRFYLK